MTMSDLPTGNFIGLEIEMQTSGNKMLTAGSVAYGLYVDTSDVTFNSEGTDSDGINTTAIFNGDIYIGDVLPQKSIRNSGIVSDDQYLFAVDGSIVATSFTTNQAFYANSLSMGKILFISSGNIGINTTSPVTTLTVDGDIFLSKQILLMI